MGIKTVPGALRPEQFYILAGRVSRLAGSVPFFIQICQPFKQFFFLVT